MQYLLTPLHAQFDSGFGATGNAFKDAADFLDKRPDAKKDNPFNANLFTTMLVEDRTAICGPRYAHEPEPPASRRDASKDMAYGEERCVICGLDSLLDL